MISNNFKLFFYFPKIAQKKCLKQKLFKLITKSIEVDNNILFSGFHSKKQFFSYLSNHLGKNSFTYNNINSNKKELISNKIIKYCRKCQKLLPYHDIPIYIFIYPWFPDDKEMKLFNGITAFASYKTIHLFISIKNFNLKSLYSTIAHEWNHLVFYLNHPEKDYSLFSYIVLEGLAEIFKNELTNENPSIWSTSLSREEVSTQLKKLSPLFNKKGIKFYNSVFLGSDKYKKWTGYSIGYWLMKNFRKNNDKMSWNEILKLNIDEFYKFNELPPA